MLLQREGGHYYGREEDREAEVDVRIASELWLVRLDEKVGRILITWFSEIRNYENPRIAELHMNWICQCSRIRRGRDSPV